MKKKKKRGLKWALSMALGFLCAMVLSVLFYGTMVYQLSGEKENDAQAQGSPAPLEAGKSAGELFPGPLLTLPAQLVRESARDEVYGGVICRVVMRTYAVDGVTATAVSATPSAYFERLSREGWTPQLITGFTLAGMDAVCETRAEESLLAARSGENVYFLQAKTDEQALYALGASAFLE